MFSQYVCLWGCVRVVPEHSSVNSKIFSYEVKYCWFYVEILKGFGSSDDGLLQQSLSHAGLIVALEKVQRHPPFQYLGHMLYLKEIKSQKIKLERMT